MDKLLKALGWLLLIVGGLFLLRGVFRLVVGKADKTEVQQARKETDANIDKLRTDVAATIKAVREENHKIARAILDEVRVKAALPAKIKPKGTAGFAGAEPEAI